MAANMRQRHKPASLTVQVTQAERQVLDRRGLVSIRATMLGQNLRRQLTSPVMLLLAGSLGFVAGYFTRRQSATPGNTDRPDASHNKFFGRALKLIALARILSKAFPPAAMDPAVQSRLSGQAPEPRFRSAAT